MIQTVRIQTRNRSGFLSDQTEGKNRHPNKVCFCLKDKRKNVEAKRKLVKHCLFVTYIPNSQIVLIDISPE